MLILIYGKDNYRSKEKLKEIIGEYKKKHQSGLNIKFLEEEEGFDDVIDFDRQVSMFDEKRLLVVSNVFSKESFKEKMHQKYQELVLSDNIFIIFHDGELRKNDKLLNAFSRESKKDKKKVIIQEYAVLSGVKMINWIKREFQERGVDIEERAVLRLQETCSEDTWRLQSEIEKLSNYKKQIRLEDVNEMISSVGDTNIFNTIEAIAKKDTKKAIHFLYRHLRKQDNPQYLLTMIVYQFRNIIIIKDLIDRGNSYSQAQQKGGLHPFVFKKTREQADIFTKKELQEIYHRLFEIDLNTKTGQEDPVLAIHLFVFATLN